MSFFSFLDFDLWRDYVSPSLDDFTIGQMRPRYLQYREKLLKTKSIFERIPRYNSLNHIISLLTGILTEGYIRNEKDFSFLRAFMYYFATYAFTSAFFVNEGVSYLSIQLGDVIDQLDETFIVEEDDDPYDEVDDGLDGYVEDLDD